MIIGAYSVVGIVLVLVLAFGALAAAIWRARPAVVRVPDAWRQYRFGYALVALVFLAFDMEMIFMYPWGVVFAEIGVTAFLDMLVFILLLGGGIAYAWGMGALEWE